MLITAIAGLAAIATYLFAGNKVWEHMMLVDNDPGCILSKEYREGTLPGWVYHFFIAAWAPLLLGVGLANLARTPRTFP